MEIKELSYVLIGAPALDKWKHYGTQVLGMADGRGPDGALYLKMDERDFRIAIIESGRDEFLAAGWLVADAQALEDWRSRIEKAGFACAAGTQAERRLRRVRDFFWFTDPAGRRQEIGWGAISSFEPFTSPIGVSGFVTDDMGLGHVVIATRNFDETVAFWCDVMQFGVSDVIDFDMGAGNPPVRINFLHCRNGRQHSLALAELDDPTGVQHMMVEVKSIDDVGYALDRVSNGGAPLALSLGRHVNDRMLSFYMVTPAGFMLEYGYGGIRVDWSNHNTFESKRGSLWGHRPQMAIPT